MKIFILDLYTYIFNQLDFLISKHWLLIKLSVLQSSFYVDICLMLVKACVFVVIIIIFII